MNKTKPFLKWAGGKFKVLDILKEKFPPGKRFVEPFLGAGSVSLNVDYSSYIVNDTNSDLVSVWENLREVGVDFVYKCEELFTVENNTADIFYDLRNEFNTTTDKLRKACLFVYLNRHCFNGLCRYNSKGLYNVPFGKYEKPYFPRVEFEACLDKVKGFVVHNKDFREIFKMVRKDDVVYCDPPYLPMSESANFDSYSVGGFALQDQIDLAELAQKSAKKGATVVVSNHNNWYSRQIYGEMYGGKVYTMEVSRTISSKTTERNRVKEIIAVFSKEKDE